MSKPANYKQVRKLYEALPESLKQYLEHFPMLVNADLPFEIAVAYLFQCVERAHRRALYVGIMKKHSANKDLTDKIVQKTHLTRADFDAIFYRVFGNKVPIKTKTYLLNAEKVRDSSMHGGLVDDPKLRGAIQDIFSYLKEFNEFVCTQASFEPCGNLRGFTGRAKKLDEATTIWILRGLGFGIV